MSNFTLNPISGADRERMLGWFEKHNHPVQSAKDDNGHIVLDYSKGDLRASNAMYALKKLAVFSDESK